MIAILDTICYTFQVGYAHRKIAFLKSEKEKMKKFPVIYVILACTAWGSAGVFVHYLSQYDFTSFQLAAVRATVSAVAALIFTLSSDKRSLRATLPQLGVFFLCGIAFFSMAAFYYMAIRESSVSTAGVLLYMSPIIVIAFSAIFWGEKITFRKCVTIACMLVGCALVTGVIGGLKFAPRGIIFGLTSCCAYAAYTICVNFANRMGAKPGAITVYSFFVASIISICFSSPSSFATNLLSVSWYVILALVAFGAITGFVASFFYSKALQRLPAGIVSAMAALEPLILTLTSVIFLNEKLTVFSAAGIVLILGSIVALSFEKK